MTNQTEEVCKICINQTWVKKEFLSEHLAIEHEEALFQCTLCDEDDGVWFRFDTFKAAQSHVRTVHNVTEDEGINSVIKLPSDPKHLRSFKCVLCSFQFYNVLQEVLKTDHFLKVHKSKKVKPNQLKRVCKICTYDRCKTDAELDEHIGAEHPKDAFADEDEDEEVDEIAKEEVKKVKVEPADEEPFAVERVSVPELKTEKNPATITRTVSIIPKCNKFPQPDTSDEDEDDDDDDDDSDDSSEESSSSSDDSVRNKKVRSKKKKEKKHKKRKKSRNRSRSVEDHSAEEKSDYDAGQPLHSKTGINNYTKMAEKRAFRGNCGFEEDVKVIHQRASRAGSNKLLRHVKVDNDIALFQGLRSKLSRDERDQGSQSLSDGEIRGGGETSPRYSNNSRNYRSNSNYNGNGDSCSPYTKRNKYRRYQSDSEDASKNTRDYSRSPPPPRSPRRETSAARINQNGNRKRIFKEDRNPVGGSITRESRRYSKLLEDYFCDACIVPVNEDNAYDHFSSKTHHMRTRNKIRCYLCSKYVENLKGHLEGTHSREVFRCNLSRCTNPKFMDLTKVLDHVQDRHYDQIRNKSNEDLIRENSISIPVNLCSYKCRICNRQFVGQNADKVLVHQKFEDGMRDPSDRDIYFFCRICGSNRGFDDEQSLLKHCNSHSRPSQSLDFRGQHKKRTYSSRRSSRSSSSEGRSRSSSRSSERSSSRKSVPTPSKRTKNYRPCMFCPQVTENTDSDQKQHQIKFHNAEMFQCRPCGQDYQSDNRFAIFEHLKIFHKICELDEDDLLKHETNIPKDIRRIYCELCQKEKKAGVVVREWRCQEIIDVEKDLQEHRAEHHPEVKLLADIIRLGCRACNDFYEFDLTSRREWKQHVENEHRKALLPPPPVTVAAASPIHAAATNSDKTSEYGGTRGAQSSPSVKSNDDFPKTSVKAGGSSTSPDYKSQDNCSYCLEPFPPGESKLQHVKRAHLNETFYCSMCSETDPATFDCRNQLTNHVDREHTGDQRNTKANRDQFVKYPKDLRCMHCYLCSTNFYGIGLPEMKDHFARAHANSSGFDPGQLDYRCRICMESGVHDDEEELLEHLRERHNCDPTAIVQDENKSIVTDVSDPVTSSGSNQKYFLPTAAGGRNCAYCYFCNYDNKQDMQRHILEQHAGQCFECKECNCKLAMDSDTMRKHLKEDHQIEANGDRDKLLAYAKFPPDHRQAKCLKCAQLFVGQESDGPLDHLKEKHSVDVTRPETNSLLILSCRWCSSRVSAFQDFASHKSICFAAAAVAASSQ